MFTQYQLDYAKRHHIPADWILENERLELAAFLEQMIKTQTLSVTEARRRYCREYPDANRLDVPLYRYDLAANTYQIDHNYALGSVLNMIQPVGDSIFSG